MGWTWKNLFYSIGLFSLCFLGVPVTIHHFDHVEEEFRVFLHQYNRTYLNDTQEYARRLSYFRDSYERARIANERHNSSNARFGITKFADFSPDEFRSVLLRHKLSDLSCVRKHRGSKLKKRQADLEIPSRVDWREKGVVTGVKNQRNCGACWAFSTIATVESMYAIQTGKLSELSVQQVIDCARNGNMGCRGGDTCSALKWMVSSNVSLVDEKEYPLTLNRESCRAPIKINPGIHVSPNFTCYNLVDSEEELQRLLAFHGPLTVAVDAVLWQDYLGGILQFHCEDRPNHAVQIVGYDLTGPVPYYIVRNSWGKDFGIDGYIHIAVGKNLCGIAREVSALTVLA